MLINLINFVYCTFLLPPGIFIVILIALCWYYSRKNHHITWGFVLLTIVFYISSSPLFGSYLIHSLEYRYTPPSKITGDVIIVLGGGATLESPNFHGEGNLLGAPANRLLTSIQIYHELQIPIIVSGGQVFKTTGVEAKIAKASLLNSGIPVSKIIMENKSRNTTENARFTKIILNKYHFTQPILITSAFHMSRAVKQFQKAGVTVLAYPVDYRTNISLKPEIRKFIPTSEALDQVSIATKEYLGLLASKWY